MPSFTNQIALMPKYRRLAADELQELETEFVRFLAAHALTGPDWERMKAERPDEAEKLIGQFSDVVFEKVIANVKYLEHRQAHDLRTYHCQDEKIVMYGLLVEGKTSLDLRQNLPPEQMMSMLQVSGARLKLYSGERAYQTSREQDIFALMEQGALISKDGEMFRLLANLQ